MRVVLQRVSRALVRVAGGADMRVSGSIGFGLAALAAVETSDTFEDAKWIAAKIASLRVFEDDSGKMNLSLEEVGGDILLVSQFTLFGNVKKGSRPSFNRSAPAEVSNSLYEALKDELSKLLGRPVECGVFGAMMELELVNDGPVTIIIDSKRRDF